MFGYFVVLSEEGQFWTGEDWSGKKEEARRFDGPPDAWADCHLAVSCLRRLGRRCSVAYLPGDERAPAQVVPVRLQLPRTQCRPRPGRK